MSEGEALDYFNARLKRGNLYAGTNYMIDCEDTVWECIVWALGGIWNIKPHRKDNTKEYSDLRRLVALRPSTVFEERE